MEKLISNQQIRKQYSHYLKCDLPVIKLLYFDMSAIFTRTAFIYETLYSPSNIAVKGHLIKYTAIKILFKKDKLTNAPPQHWVNIGWSSQHYVFTKDFVLFKSINRMTIYKHQLRK